MLGRCCTSVSRTYRAPTTTRASSSAATATAPTATSGPMSAAAQNAPSSPTPQPASADGAVTIRADLRQVRRSPPRLVREPLSSPHRRDPIMEHAGLPHRVGSIRTRFEAEELVMDEITATRICRTRWARQHHPATRRPDQGQRRPDVGLPGTPRLRAGQPRTPTLVTRREEALTTPQPTVHTRKRGTGADQPPAASTRTPTLRRATGGKEPSSEFRACHVRAAATAKVRPGNVQRRRGYPDLRSRPGLSWFSGDARWAPSSGEGPTPPHPDGAEGKNRCR